MTRRDARKVRLKVGRTQVECLPDQIPEVLRRLGVEPIPQSGGQGGFLPKRDHAESLYSALCALQRRKAGMSSEDLAEYLDLAGPRGLSRTILVWRKVADELGLDLARLIVHSRDKRRHYWLPGPDLAAAIRALEQGLKAKQMKKQE